MGRHTWAEVDPPPTITPHPPCLPITLTSGSIWTSHLLTCPYPPDVPYSPGGPENFSTLLPLPPYLPSGLMVRFGALHYLPAYLHPLIPHTFLDLLFAPSSLAPPLTLGGPTGFLYLLTCPYPPDFPTTLGGRRNFPPDFHYLMIRPYPSSPNGWISVGLLGPCLLSPSPYMAPHPPHVGVDFPPTIRPFLLGSSYDPSWACWLHLPLDLPLPS